MSLAKLAPQSWSREESPAQATAATMYTAPGTLQTIIMSVFLTIFVYYQMTERSSTRKIIQMI